MIRLSYESLIMNAQKFVRSCPDFRAFTRLSCVHVQTFVRSCPDFRAFIRLSCVHVQTFVRSCPDFRAFMSRLSCVHVQTFVRSCPDFRAFIRLSCVHVQTFVRSCPDFRAFDRLSCVHVQTFVRFSMFPDYVILNARRPPRAFIFGLDILASLWDLNLGLSVQNGWYRILLSRTNIGSANRAACKVRKFTSQLNFFEMIF